MHPKLQRFENTLKVLTDVQNAFQSVGMRPVETEHLTTDGGHLFAHDYLNRPNLRVSACLLMKHTLEQTSVLLTVRFGAKETDNGFDWRYTDDRNTYHLESRRLVAGDQASQLFSELTKGWSEQQLRANSLHQSLADLILMTLVGRIRRLSDT